MTESFRPYLGPCPYQANHQNIFFGRATEISTIKSLLVAHPVVLLHAQSGIGKTSLINAGLLPLLEKEGMEVFPPARVRGSIPNGMRPEGIKNLYMLNVILSWIEHDTVQPVEVAKLTLAEFLKSREHRRDQAHQLTLRVLILDQFEELFVLYPERWREREDFFVQIAEALDQDRLLRVLIVVREDYLANLDHYSMILPDLLQTRFRLEALREKAALEAITGPLSGTERSFAAGVAEELVENLRKLKVKTAAGNNEVIAGEFIEPVQLQVVCQMLWERLDSNASSITHEDLTAFGDVDQALRDFYETSIRKTAAASGTSEMELREWFEETLITPGGTRGSVWQGSGLTAAAVAQLEDLHIIRGYWHTGALWYELVHDRFIDPIRKSNALWFGERCQKIETGKRLEASARGWVSQGKGRGGLLEEVELLKAESWLSSLTAEDKPCSELVASFIEKSRSVIEAEKVRQEEERRKELQRAQQLAAQVARTEEEHRSKRHARIISGFLAVACGLLVLAAYAAYQNKEIVRRQLQSSELARAAFVNLVRDPDLSPLLALEGMKRTYQKDGTVSEFAAVSMMRLLQSPPLETAALDGLEVGAYSADGRFLAIASRNKSVRIRDIATGRELAKLDLQVAPDALALSEDGQLLAAVGKAEKGSSWEAKVWEVRTGRLVKTLHHGYEIFAVAFSPDASLVATASEDKTASISSLTSEKSPIVLPHDSEVLSIAFSPDGKRLATGSKDGRLWVWDAATSKSGPPPLQMLKVGSSPILAVAFTPDGTKIATASGHLERVAQLWDPKIPTPLQTFSGHTGAVDRLAFSQDGKLATASDDGTVKLWQTESGKELQANIIHQSAILCMAFDRSRNRLLTASKDQMARSWPIPGQQFTVTDRIYAIAYSPDGKYVATANSGGSATLWDSRSHEQVRIFPGHADYVFGVAFSPDGKRLATASWDNTVKLWNIETGKEEAPALTGHRSAVYQVAFSPDGRRLATASSDGTVGIWDLATRVRLRYLLNPRGGMYGVTFSPDGKRLAVVGEDGMAKLYDATNFGELVTLKGHGRAMIQCVAFSKDGKRVATAGADKTVRIFDADTGVCQVTIRGHSQIVWSVAFSPDGKRLATASWDKTARLWDSRTGKELVPLVAHTDRVYGVAFSPSGTHLATGGRDGKWNINILDPETLIQSVVKRINRSFTEEECRRYVDSGGPFPEFTQGMAALARRTGLERLAGRLEAKQGCPPQVKALAAVAAGNNLARCGDYRRAAEEYARAKKLDPTLRFDPEAQAKELAAQPIMERAYQLAYQGKKEAAVELFRAAKKIDSERTIDPISVVRRVAMVRITESMKAARSSGKTDWAKVFGERLLPDPDLRSSLDKILALQLVVRGKEQARSGNTMGATKNFRMAKGIYPELPIDPKQETDRVEAAILEQRGERLLKPTQLLLAIEAFRKAEQLDKNAIPASAWNRLCWSGTILGEAANPKVREACENAVLYGYDNPVFRDSRGLNRAWNGDTKGAIEDFNVFVAQSKRWQQESVSEEEKKRLENEQKRRETWVRRLSTRQPLFRDSREAEELLR